MAETQTKADADAGASTQFSTLSEFLKARPPPPQKRSSVSKKPCPGRRRSSVRQQQQQQVADQMFMLHMARVSRWEALNSYFPTSDERTRGSDGGDSDSDKGPASRFTSSSSSSSPQSQSPTSFHH